MGADRTIEFLLIAKDQASGAIGKVGDSAQKAGGHLLSLGNVVKGGAIAAGVAGIAAAGDLIGSAFADAVDAQKSMALLTNQINNLGAAGKEAFAGASDFANTLSGNIGQDDDDIRKIQAKLASFPDAFRKGSDGADAMRRATAAAFDLQALGIGDANSNIIGIGKALNDPIKGMTALSKAGVSFNDEQKAAIKLAMQHGDLAKAQQILLSGIESNAKGAAANSVDNITKLKVAFANFTSGVVGMALPAIEKLAGFLQNSVLPVFGNLFSAFTDVNTPIGEFVYTLTNLSATIGDDDDDVARLAATIRDDAVAAFKGLTVIVSGVVGWVRDNLIPAFVHAYQEVLPAVQKAISTVSAVFRDHQGVVQFVVTIFKVLGLLITDLIIPTLAGVAKTLLELLGPALRAIFTVLEDVLIPAFKFLLSTVLTVFGGILDGVAAAFGWVPGIGPKLKGAAAQFDKFRDEANAALSGIQDKTVTVNITTKGLNNNLLNSKLSQIEARALGGPVNAGQPYLVGENGPELYVPGSAGTIIPNGANQRGGVGGGNVVINVPSGYVGSPEQLARLVSDALRRSGARGVALATA